MSEWGWGSEKNYFTNIKNEVWKFHDLKDLVNWILSNTRIDIQSFIHGLFTNWKW